MLQAIKWSALSVLLTGSAIAADGQGPETLIPHPDWIIFILSLALAAWWSIKAFDRPAIKLADIPTFPRYMTRPRQYLLGKVLFVMVCLVIYCLMVRYHSDLPQIIQMASPDLAERLKSTIEQKDPSYLIVAIIASGSFLVLLGTEANWNPIVVGREVIYSWVSIPRLANDIVAHSKDALVIPDVARETVAREEPDWHIHASDFDKNSQSLDRAWAELCYINWWLCRQHAMRGDSTFFSEQSFAWNDLTQRFDDLRLMMVGLKSGSSENDDEVAHVMADVSEHREKLGRLVACYLVYMNSARATLIAQASEFGINLGRETPSDNPLRYSAIYIIALVAAVYMGVFFSAVGYDLLGGAGILTAIGDQDMTDVKKWIILSCGNYGVPVLGVLAIRNFAWRVNPVRNYSIAAAYAWIFVIGAVLSTLGLTFAVEIAGRLAGHWAEFFDIASANAKWSVGPALLSVYINHYLDRQIDPRLPNIGQGHEPPALRVGYAFLFTLLVMLLTLPCLPTIHAREGAIWPESKLRVIAMGTVFCVTLALSLVAQFALRKPAAAALSDEVHATDSRLRLG